VINITVLAGMCVRNWIISFHRCRRDKDAAHRGAHGRSIIAWVLLTIDNGLSSVLAIPWPARFMFQPIFCRRRHRPGDDRSRVSVRKTSGSKVTG